MLNNILPDFQKYILKNELAPENQIPFYANWVNKFIRFSNTLQDKPLDLRIQLFLDALRKDQELQDWQITQADNAITLYINHFLPISGGVAKLSPNNIAPENKFPNDQEILKKIREALRIKHYAYSTERTYIDWFKRFHEYLIGVKNKDWSTQGADETDVRDFLSHLAIKKQVSSSTQNQAFNALLFLFREVLKINLGDLGKTVRAIFSGTEFYILLQNQINSDPFFISFDVTTRRARSPAPT